MTHAERAILTTPADAGLWVLRGCSRRGLLSTTALQAVAVVSVLALIQPARAQLSPMARPAGGQVVAGQASIAQTANKTTITQSTQNAAVNWKSYNIGSGQTVQYIDPSSKSITLNRVIGANPSEIAGRIISNGTVMIINQAGLLFDGSAQINTAGLVVSAAGISNSNFLAGKMVFDQAPNPGAKIENRGTITIKDRGLAVLVAPRVVNSGVIRANLGKVILAGAETSVLDLYGDGMVSINVTKQVATAPDGGAALVTNTGVITASGGTVLLTAQAVDGVVQTLVNAGGTITADSVIGRTGRVLISGAGGDVVVVGTVAANGRAPGTTGGTVVVNTTANVMLASSANVSASGPAGGGLVAVGTTVKRAVGGPSVTGQKTAKAATIAKGAVIDVSASTNGNGGRVVLLSTDRTTMAGTISAMGGFLGGDGGFVEISGGLMALSGHVRASAPHGAMGTLFLDPLDLYVSDTKPTAATYTVVAGNLPVTAGTAPDTATMSWVSPAVLQGVAANISLATTRDLFVASGNGTANTLTLGSHTLTLLAGANLTIDRGFTIGAGGISLRATSSNITLDGISGVAAGLISAPQIVALGPTSLQASAGANLTMVAGNTIAFGTAIVGSSATPWATIDLTAGGGGITQATSGSLVAGTLTGSAGTSASFTGSNAIGTLGAFTTVGGFRLTDGAALSIAGAISSGGTVVVNDGAFALSVPGSISGSAATLTAGTIGIGGTLGVTGVASLAASSGGITETGVLNAGMLTGGAGTSASFTGSNLIGTLGAFTTVGGFTLTDGAALSIAGAISGGGTVVVNDGAFALRVLGSISGSAATLTAGTIGIGGTLGVTGVASLTASSGAITETGVLNAGMLTGGAGTSASFTGSNLIGTLGAFTTAGGFILKDTAALTVIGLVTAPSNIYLQDSSTGITIAASGGVGAGTSQRVGFRTDGLTIVSGGTVTGGTFELAPNTVGGTMNVGSSGGSSLLSVSGIGPTNLRLGAITAPGASSITTTAGSISFAGVFGAGTIALELDTTGAITQGAGAVLTAGTLTGNAGGTVGLLGTANAIGTVAAFAVTGLNYDFTLVDTGNLAVSGVLTATRDVALGTSGMGAIIATGSIGAGQALLAISGSGGIALNTGAVLTGPAIVLNGAAGGIALNGNAMLGQSGGLIDLTASGTGVTQATTSTVTAATLQSSGGVAGTVGLLGTANAIGTITTLTLVGTLTVVDSQALTLAGLVSVGNVGTVDLHTTAGGITQASTGTLVAGTLTSTGGIAGGAILQGAANKIGTISGVTAGGILTVVDSQALTLAGLVGSGNTGLVDITTTTGGVTQAGTGMLIAGTLLSSGGIKGAVLLQGTANQIANLGSAASTPGALQATGAIAITDSVDLTIAGNVIAGSSGTLAPPTASLSIALPGNKALTVNGQAIAASSAGGVTLTAGSITLAQSGAAVPEVEAKAAVVLSATSTLLQTAGAIDGGSVSLTAPVNATLANGTIVASTGTIGVFTPSATVSAGEIIAALNTANSVSFSGNLTQAASSYIGSNGTIAVGSLLTETGGTLFSVGNVTLGSLSQSAGTIATAGNLTIGSGTGVAGIVGSSATAGTFAQSGGMLAANGNANIFTTGTFAQSAGAVLATGGTLGATATQGIDIGGTVSAAGTATGFMLLANGGNAVLETTGLLGGAALSVPGDTIPGNALQASAGTVRIAGTSGTQAFGQAGSVGPIAAVNGYVIATPANPSAVTRLLSPTIGSPALATATPVKLSGGTIDLERPVTASTLGLFATTSITEGPSAGINAIRLTGSSAAAVNLLSSTNTIGTLGDFNNAGFAFNLVDASNLMLAGVLSARSVEITDANFSIDLNGAVLATDSINMTAGGTIRVAGKALAGTSANLTAGGAITVGGTVSAGNTVGMATGGTFNFGGTVSAADNVTVKADGRVDLAGLLSANVVEIRAGGLLNLATGSRFSGVGAGSTSPLNNDTFVSVYDPKNPNRTFTSGVPAGIYLVASDFTASPNPTVITSSTINWTFALKGGGNVGLGNFQQPSVKLFLDLASGTAVGQVNVAGMQVRYTTATMAIIDLTGSIGGISGTTAASNAHISPLPKDNYQINGCPISSVNCIKFTGLTVPVVNPLQEVQFGWVQTVSDTDVALPDVAERDY